MKRFIKRTVTAIAIAAMCYVGGLSAAFLLLPLPVMAQSGAFILPFSGAIARTINQKLSDFVSPKDLGLACDGSTTNSSTVINRASDAVKALKTRLWFPGGICKFGATMDLYNSGSGGTDIGVDGQGPLTTKIEVTGDFPAFKSIGTVSLPGLQPTVRNLSIKCSGKANASADGIYFKFPRDGLVDNVFLYACNKAVRVADSYLTSLRRIRIDGQGTEQNNYGTYLDEADVTNTSQNNVVIFDDINAQHTAIAAHRWITFQGSSGTGRVEGGGDGYGFYLCDGVTAIPCKFGHFTHLIADSTGNIGFLMKKGSSVTEMSHFQATLVWAASSNGNAGIRIEGGTNIIFSDMDINNVGNGLEIVSTTNSRFSGIISNYNTGNNKSAVLLDASSGNVLSGIRSFTSTGTGATSIKEITTSDTNMISGGIQQHAYALIGANSILCEGGWACARVNSGSYNGVFSNSSAINVQTAGTDRGVFQASGLGLLSGGYLNFGTTYGTSGRGIWDDAGTPKVKRTSGSWSAIPGLDTSDVFTNKSMSGSANTFTNIPVSTAISGLGTGVGTALGINVGSAGAPVINGGALGTPSSGSLASATGLPISTGVSGLGANVATFLATPSSANLAAALTDETGSGVVPFMTESTCTPVLQGGSTAGTFTPATQICSYEKTGRKVTARIHVAGTLAGAVGGMQIAGLPVAAANTTDDYGQCSITYIAGATLSAGYTLVSGLITWNTSVVRIQESGPAAGNNTQDAAVGRFSGTIRLIVTCSYHT